MAIKFIRTTDGVRDAASVVMETENNDLQKEDMLKLFRDFMRACGMEMGTLSEAAPDPYAAYRNQEDNS
jgi:hypothetical protein